MTWEMSFFMTHTGVISAWKGTDGLEENLWMEEGQGKTLQGLASRGVREAQVWTRGAAVPADSGTWSTEETTRIRTG